MENTEGNAQRAARHRRARAGEFREVLREDPDRAREHKMRQYFRMPKRYRRTKGEERDKKIFFLGNESVNLLKTKG